MMYGKSVLDGIWSFSFAGEGSLLRGTCPTSGDEIFPAVPGGDDVAASFSVGWERRDRGAEKFQFTREKNGFLSGS